MVPRNRRWPGCSLPLPGCYYIPLVVATCDKRFSRTSYHIQNSDIHLYCLCFSWKERSRKTRAHLERISLSIKTEEVAARLKGER